MDLTTLLGLVVAWGAVLVSVMIEGGNLSSLWNLPAFLIVVGGTIGATIVGLPLGRAREVPNILIQAFIGRRVDSSGVMAVLLDFIRRARRDGILALEGEIETLDNEFLRSSLQLVIDGTSQELLQESLATELRAMRARHSVGQSVFDTLGGFAPTLGIIGTVMGLIHMLGKLDRPEEMGHSIAAAFVATLYGVSIANLIFLPIANKLRCNSEDELAAYRLAVEGILALQAGESPHLAGARMRAFLAPRAKQDMDGKGA